MGLPSIVKKKKKPSFSEAEIERLVCDYLYAKRIFFWKQPQGGFFDTGVKRFRKHTSPYVRRGIPDLIMIHEGKFIGLEIKSSIGQMSDAQKAFQKDIEKAGGSYFLVRSIEGLQTILRGIYGNYDENTQLPSGADSTLGRV